MKLAVNCLKAALISSFPLGQFTDLFLAYNGSKLLYINKEKGEKLPFLFCQQKDNAENMPAS